MDAQLKTERETSTEAANFLDEAVPKLSATAKTSDEWLKKESRDHVRCCGHTDT